MLQRQMLEAEDQLRAGINEMLTHWGDRATEGAHQMFKTDLGTKENNNVPSLIFNIVYNVVK